jgi:hypothetical protein
MFRGTVMGARRRRIRGSFRRIVASAAVSLLSCTGMVVLPVSSAAMPAPSPATSSRKATTPVVPGARKAKTPVPSSVRKARTPARPSAMRQSDPPTELAPGEVSTAAGTGQGGSTNGAGTSATFYRPQGVDIIDGFAYVFENMLVRKVNVSTNQVTTAAGTGDYGCVDATDPLQARVAGTGVVAHDSGSGENRGRATRRAWRARPGR